MLLKIYYVISTLLIPFTGIYINRRIRLNKEDSKRFKERYGIASVYRAKGSLIWLHAASVGESLSILPIINELEKRITFLINLGLGYLTVNRKSNSLSGGETQRINIAKSIGSGLVGAWYILDEPSIGLHAKDTKKLIKILKNKKIWNVSPQKVFNDIKFL